ncbi:MAG: aldehyde:ferredoxin oxidoreductase [Synergistaceae bacterium]|nr:aldehyde:ferredoxin oxidoreductase [Synergistaceae bacterium]
MVFPVLAEWSYTPEKVTHGYTRRTLYVNVGERRFESRPVSDEMIEKFTGGRGFGLRLLWNAVNEQTRWDSPENEMVVSSGPIGGITQYPGAGKCYSVFLSPLSGQTYDSNAGGYFGPLLKFSGFDALEIQGKSSERILLFIDGDSGKVQILEAPAFAEDNSYEITETLHEAFSENEADKRNISVISTGHAGEHSFWAGMNHSFYDLRRKAPRLKQAGRGGGGRVLRDKGIMAIVVRKRGVSGTSNDPVDLDTLQRVGTKLHKEIATLDDQQCRMRRQGTAHLNRIMNDYELLPVNNFKFGSHPDIANIDPFVYEKYFTQNMPDGCWYGCSMACSKAADNFLLKTGPWAGRKVLVDGPEYETAAALGSDIGIFDPEWTLEANFYADHYGLDTISLGNGLAFVCECFELGFLDETKTNGLTLRFGSKADLMELIHRIAEGKDPFALTVGQGVRRMKKAFAEQYGAPIETMEAIGMEGQGVEVSQYVCKESIAQWGGYFLTLKGPQHDEAWLIFMDMVNKQLPTFEDKAEALSYFPNFRLWFSLVGLCKLPWNDIEPADNQVKYRGIEAAKVPEHVQNYVDLFTAVTGKAVTKEDLLLMSERVYNFQRVFQLRMGKGTRKDHNIPLRALGPVFPDEWEARKEYYDGRLREIGVSPEGLSSAEKIEKLQKHRLAEWEKLVDAVYKRRGWNRNGIPTLETLRRLGIDEPEVVEVVKKHLRPEDAW